MAITSDGKCVFCGEIFNKTMMSKHLKKCSVKTEKYLIKDENSIEKYYCISVCGAHNPEYWLYIDVQANSTLKALDAFLRKIWLECCGHFSSFEIDKQTFSISPDKEFGDRSMNIKLINILDVGTLFRHEYDFGSTTVLKLKVVSEFYANKRKKNVELLARNVAPFIKCTHCEKPATVVCCECIYDDAGWLCDDCSEKHECDEDMFLPVVNSPRVGVCAYEGGFE